MSRAALMLARFIAVLSSISTGAIFPATAAELTFDLRIEHGRVPATMRLIRVNEGDIVTLRWTADQPLVVHLHGYDVEKRIATGAVTELTFTAYATGRFPIYVHAPGERAGSPGHEEAALVDVEVYPR